MTSSELLGVSMNAPNVQFRCLTISKIEVD